MNDYMNYPQECKVESLVPFKPDLIEGLKMRRARVQKQVDEIDEALAALEANPEIAKVLELVGRASRH